MNARLRAVGVGTIVLTLILGTSPATGAGSAGPSPDPPASSDLGPLPVDAVDVTTTDDDLAATDSEVTVLTTDASGTPEVSKLRADTPHEAEALAEFLDSQPGVVAAPTTPMRAFAANTEPMAPQQWNLDMVRAPAAWDTSRGSGVVVAVIDTGVDATHPDLAGRVLPEINLVPEAVRDAYDTNHGTRVASLVASAVNGVGMAGVAPLAQILPVAALQPNGVGDSATVAEGIIRAADAGARVINLSLGGPDRDPVLDAACLHAYTKGSIVVAAAGNTYEYGNPVQYPAASPHVVAVAAVDSTGTPGPFSNTGPHIALAAPGVNVPAAVHGGYDVQSGTSFAAPHVAGALALVAAANPALTVSQIISVTELTAQDDASGDGRDDQYGYGTVRPDRAVAAAMSLRSDSPPAGAALRLRSFNAKPDPIRRGDVATLVVRLQAKYPDRKWRNSPAPTEVRFQFKRRGSRKYRTVLLGATQPNGWAEVSVVPTRSGRWRAQVRQPSGRWKSSGSDYLKVKRRR